MSELHARIERMTTLEAEERYGELLAFLQELYAQAEAAEAPARTDYFMTLFQWKMLIEKYAPAAAALAGARDEQARRLLAGERHTGTVAWPEDHPRIFERVQRISLIVDMDETLDDPHATHALFLQLEEHDPVLARRYAWRVLPAMVEVRDFVRADRYRGDPLEQLATVNDNARTWPLFPAGLQAPRLGADLMGLTREVRIAIAVLRGLDRAEEAGTLRAALLDGLANDELRSMAARELEEPGFINRTLVEHRMAQEEANPAMPAEQAQGSNAGRPNK